MNTPTLPNLIPRERRRTAERRRRTHAWLRFLRAYSILLAIASGLIMLPARADSDSLASTLSRLDKRIEFTGTETTKAKKAVADLNRVLAVAQAVGDHPDWSLVLEAVARARGGEVTLDSFELTTTHPEDKPAKPGEKPKPVSRDIHTIRLAGFASSPAAAFEFANRLDQLRFADSVNVKDTRPQTLGAAGAAPMTHFDIELLIASTPTLPSTSDNEGGAK